MKRTLLILLAMAFGMFSVPNMAVARQNDATKNVGLRVLKKGDPITVNGTVTTIHGEPLIGVNVKVKGAAEGIVTDTNGNFSIDCRVGDILVFIYTGYEPLEIEVKEGSMKGTMKECESVLG